MKKTLIESYFPLHLHRSITMQSQIKRIASQSSKQLASRRRVTDIIDEVAKQTGITRAQIMGRTRTNDVVAARHEVWYLASKEGRSFCEIARFFNKNNTSVSYGVWRHAHLNNLPHLSGYKPKRRLVFAGGV